MDVIQLGGLRSVASCDHVMTVAMRVSPSSHDLGPVRRLAAVTAGAVQVDADDAALVATELVTNALLHTRSDSLGADLAFTTTSVGGLRVCVFDAGGPATGPSLSSATPGAKSGRGLSIVQKIATEWGVSGDESGRIVWARLTADDSPPSPT